MLAAFAFGTPDAILSTGYCGALAESMGVADIFIANRVVAPEADEAFDARSVKSEQIPGTLVSVDRVATTAGEKSELHRQGYAAVEMEAAGVAHLARERDLPFYCVRAVSDRAAESLPLDLNEFRDQDGRFRKTAIAAAAMRSPSVAKNLIRLDRQCRAASEALGEFLATCRFS
jgi:adenosylhomocysteine nucleosidase